MWLVQDDIAFKWKYYCVSWYDRALAEGLSHSIFGL